MAALQQFLARQATDWISNNQAKITDGGLNELLNLLSLAELRATARPVFAQGRVPIGSADLDEVTKNLESILVKAAAAAAPNPIDIHELQSARLALCPLFPFC